MKNTCINNKMEKYLITFTLLALVGCAATMDVVEKSLEDGDLVPEQALATADFLNEYTHPLPSPRSELVDIDIAFERPNVLAAGDTLYVQVGVTTREPTVQATQFHVLIFNPDTLNTANNTRLQSFANAVQTLPRGLPKGSALTIDTVNPIPGLANEAPKLIVHKNAPDLVQFLRGYARAPLGTSHHYILVLADPGQLTRSQKQDLVDIASIFSVKSAKLSVLSFGDSPQMAFLQALSEKGRGTFNVVTERFDTASWYSQELQYANAIKLNDIHMSMQTRNGATIKRVVSPLDFNWSKSGLDKTIPELIQGRSYVVMSELQIPPSLSPETNEIVSVTVDYFDPLQKRYKSLGKTAEVRYVPDRNETLAQNDHKVARSLLILDTQSVLQEIVPVIRQQRYYHAASLLTGQSLRLNEYAQEHNDRELQRDAQILSRYADHLFVYDEKKFQTLNIWHDLSWDTRRYTEKYQ